MTPGTGRHRRQVWIPSWTAIAIAILLAVAAPFGSLVAAAWPGSPDLWTHLARYVLPDAIRVTALLLVGVGVLTSIIGTALAWLVATCEFRGRWLVEAAALLPLSVPTYIVAYAYLDVLHPVGPVQETLRAWLGYDSPRDFRLPDVRSLPACIVLLSAVLYPYVYLPTRALFALQSASLLEAGRTLGLTQGQSFIRLAVPLARPAIALGVGLALMEALNDIGAAEFLGVRTLTVSIYSTWITRSDLAGAAQIALGMLLMVLAIVQTERWARRHQQFVNDSQSPRPFPVRRLSTARGFIALATALVPVTIGFVVPAIYLVDATFDRLMSHGIPEGLFSALWSTVTLSLGATAVGTALGVLLSFAVHRTRHWLTTTALTIASIGYATPGTVVAIALLPLVTALDRSIDGVARAMFETTMGMVVLGSGGAVVYAYVVRFLAVTAGGADTALAKLPGSLDEAAATLGATTGERLLRVHLPLMRPAVTAAAFLMFVDCMKELPATLMLRPLGVETLSTMLYGEAVRGTYEYGAVAALLIVACSFTPVVLLARSPLRHAQTVR